mgnify:CR=1 FL=1
MLNVLLGIIICGVFLMACSGAMLIVMDKQKKFNARKRGDK